MTNDPGDPPDGGDNPFKGTPFEQMFAAFGGGPGGGGMPDLSALMSQMQAMMQPHEGAVNWTLDPDFDPPTAKTRTLHLLATDYECVGEARLRGRLAPAWVFLQPNIVWVQLFARRLEPDAECIDQKPTKATVRLPEAVGKRELVDVNPTPCRGCGG